MKFLKRIKIIPKEKMIVPLLLAYFLILGIADYLVCITWQRYVH